MQNILFAFLVACAAPDADIGDGGAELRRSFPLLDVSCTSARPHGLCLNGLCVNGRCVPRCSADRPGGACEGGAICRDGRCDELACRALSTSEECVRCMEEHRCDALLACWDPGALTYIDCWDCMVHADPPNVCVCRERVPACAGCDHRPFIGCVERHCPSC